MSKDRVVPEAASPYAETLEQLRGLLPGAFSEGRVDCDKLRETLGDGVSGDQERYAFTWAGKQDSIRQLQVPSRASLSPCPEESLECDTTGHVFIEGENLEVLKLLYRTYFGRIKMIYIDPPYNTGNDFVYEDSFTDPLGHYLELTGQADAEGNLLTSNPETSGRYHSVWLSMMYPRLFVARQLLRQDGCIFVSIDDHEVANLRLLLNEVFGEENFVECFIWKKSYGGGAKEKHAITQHEYVLMYARDKASLGTLWLPPDPDAEARYYKFKDSRGPYRLKPLEATKSMDRRDNLVFPIPLPWGGEVWPDYQWWWSSDRVARAIASDELDFRRDGDQVTVSYKQYLYDESGQQRGAKPFSVIDTIYTQHGTAEIRDLFDDRIVMQFPKPVALLEQCIQMATAPSAGDLVIDFFAGSCTTAQAVLSANRSDQGNRRFIMVQMPEPTPDGSVARQMGLASVAEIGKERIRRVAARYHETSSPQLELQACNAAPDLGFRTFKLVPSNYQQWSGVAHDDPSAYTEQMASFTDPLIDGWTPHDVLWEVALKEGVSLSSRVEELAVKPNRVWRVWDADTGQSFLLCLDDTVGRDTPAALALDADTLFICRDAALTDEVAANLALQCRLKTI